MTEAVSLERRRGLYRRALRLEYFTVGWNVIEAVVAIGAGIIASSVALVGFGVDSGVEVISAVGLLWRLRTAGPTATVQEESAAERRPLCGGRDVLPPGRLHHRGGWQRPPAGGAA
jgi:hypothetical protein